ncbi:hypothetical protein DL767_005454 [Monosporascus sp. MG133]|nr:hypothetical protein DL767_005454 [Monosporascus sp. MG133]
MKALAPADGAFLYEFDSAERIYESLVVTESSDRLRLHWKREWRDRPISRDVELADGVQVFLEKALAYSKARNHLIWLSRALGYAKRLEFYDIRCGFSKTVNDEERSRWRCISEVIAGHYLLRHLHWERGTRLWGTRPGTRRPMSGNYYMPHLIDPYKQATIFESDLQSDLAHRMGRLMRYSHTPTELTDQQRYEVHNEPRLAKLRRERDRIATVIKESGYKTYAAFRKLHCSNNGKNFRK